MFKIVAQTLALAALSGCATAARDLPATPFDGSIYADWACPRITSELEFVTSRLMLQSSQQEARRQTWFMGNEGAQFVSRLKGQREALIAASEAKRCVERRLELQGDQ